MDTNRQHYTQWLLQAEEAVRGGFTSNSNEDQGTGKEWCFRSTEETMQIDQG